MLSQEPPVNATYVSSSHKTEIVQRKTHFLAARTILAFRSLKLASRFSALSSHLCSGSTALVLDSAPVELCATRLCKLYFEINDSLGCDVDAAFCAAR